MLVEYSSAKLLLLLFGLIFHLASVPKPILFVTRAPSGVTVTLILLFVPKIKVSSPTLPMYAEY